MVVVCFLIGVVKGSDEKERRGGACRLSSGGQERRQDRHREVHR